jgi:quercetin dioxygenase-like cupin family protein
VNEAMRVLRADEQAAPADGAGLAATWLRGPLQDDRLDVAVVHFGPGAATPLHVHFGGQVLVAISGRGFVEVDGVRTSLGPGDVVVTPAGEQHVHGAETAGPFSHVSVTTGRNQLLTDELDYPATPNQ